MIASLRRRTDAGVESLEWLIVTPVILAVLSLILFGGRIALARQAVDTAAWDAARAASLASKSSQATSDAVAAAAASLTSQRLACTPVVKADTSEFSRPAGVPAQVTVTVSCTVSNADLFVVGVPGTSTLTATATSPLDTYRERR